jgi:hypothetical protein
MKGPVFGSILLGLWMGMAWSQGPPTANPEPLQAELLANLNVRKISAGKTVFARVTQDWKGQDCVLHSGATLEGTVEESVPRVGKGDSKLSLSFKQAQCNGREMQPLELVLAVIAQAPSDWSLVPSAQYRMSMDFPNPHPVSPVSKVSTTTRLPGELYQPNQGFYQAHMELGGVAHRFPVRKNIRLGDVLDFKGLSLAMGAGPHRSTVISSKVRDVFLAEFTQMLLVPPGLASAATATQLASDGGVQPRGGNGLVRAPSLKTTIAAAPPPINDIEICAPPGCAVDLPVSAPELAGHTASSIGTHALGYTPRTNKILGSFAEEESLAWLGAGKLLFTFNPHRLVKRGKGDQGSTARLIRAVLLDTATRNVVRAVDWEITDSRRYLWPLDAERILVHVGNELRVYGTALDVERTIPLAGPLLFIRIAPSGGPMAIATLRERHSAELHAKLRSELDSEPEEDVDVAILDKEFNTAARVSTVSDLMPPTLLNEGQVKLQAEPGHWYRLAMSSWESKRSALARFRSLCMPEVTSTAPDLLFLLTCNAKDGNTEYSVLRPDGKVLLRGVSDPQELGHEAMGNHGSRSFAVKIVHAERSIATNTTFKSSELDSEEVRVYRAEDGKRLLAVRVKAPIASRGGYALSPDGAQLAVLSGEEIELFAVPVR